MTTAWRRVEEGKVGDDEVEEGGGEDVLWRKTIGGREAAARCLLGKGVDYRSAGSWISKTAGTHGRSVFGDSIFQGKLSNIGWTD